MKEAKYYFTCVMLVEVQNFIPFTIYEFAKKKEPQLLDRAHRQIHQLNSHQQNPFQDHCQFVLMSHTKAFFALKTRQNIKNNKTRIPAEFLFDFVYVS